MTASNGVFWVGADGNYYVKTSTSNGVQNLGSASSPDNPNVDVINGLTQIDDPATLVQNNTTTNNTTSDADAARRAVLKNEIAGRTQSVEDAYNSLFGSLDALLKDRAAQLETQYADQFKKAGDQYAEAIPQIETSYAALGAADSTDNTYAKNSAKKGFEETTATIGKNKEADKTKLGQYGNESRAKFQADKDAALRYIDSAANTTDVSALQDAKNSLDTNLSQTGVTRATLGTDGQAKASVDNLTADNGRFAAATSALDGVIKSSLSGAVKQAAVQAIADNSGLSDTEKKKIQEQYGNVYAEQQAL